ncbi:LacI family DNA-binding transcriptional regulator [Brachybacterium subflavum]|uniref:LacI family DNA-binding transcriptional regulator n=1 Tax=Brachybacterium subflavum TaxID=2585206 RepID=UPI001266241F|nr:LacI family DNA-binding transcriptional regulator [Brachybacterium subflavum]
MATRLQDIAERVGVSPSSVSLVLNGRADGRVNAVSAARIREVAEDMGYMPNMLARGLKTRSSKTIGVLAEGVASIPFSGQMLAGAQEAAWRQGYLLMVVDTGHHSDRNVRAIKALIQRDVDALIVAADYPRDVRIPDVPAQIPVIALSAIPHPEDAEHRRVDAVLPDDEAGAFTAVTDLLRAGHRRVAFLNLDHTGFEYAQTQRLAGYRRAFTEAGLETEDRYIATAPGPETVDGQDAAARLLAGPEPPTAVFCFSDRIAVAVYHAAASCGLRIPEDLSVIGFDDQDGVANSLSPGLSTVRLPHREMGEWAARTAIRRVHGYGGPSLKQLVPCPPITRGSVGPAH